VPDRDLLNLDNLNISRVNINIVGQQSTCRFSLCLTIDFTWRPVMHHAAYYHFR